MNTLTVRYFNLNNEVITSSGVDMCSAGVIIPVGAHSETLIPWNKVVDVTATEIGLIRLILSRDL